MLLTLTSFLPMQKTDLYPADTVRLTVLRERSDIKQMDSLQTDNTQSFQTEQLTAMWHRSADRLEGSADIWMTGLGTTSDVEGKLLVSSSGN